LVPRRPRPAKPQPLATTALVRRRPRPPKPQPPTLNLRELVEADRDPAAKYDRLPRLPGLEPRNTDPSGEGYASGYGRRRKKIFYDVPEAPLGELSVVSSSLDAFSGSLALREKPSASDYEKLPGAPSFGAVELFSAALDDEKPDMTQTTPVKQRLFEPDLPPYSPQYVPKPSPVSDDESVARRAFPFSPPHTRKLHIKPRPKTWSGVRVRVFGDMAARELLTGAFRAEDRRSKSAPSAWKAVKKRVHGDMAARELLMGAYRTDADEIDDWRDPNEATFQQTPGAELMSPGAMSPPSGVAPYGHTPAKADQDPGSPEKQDQAAAKVQARIRGRNAREAVGRRMPMRPSFDDGGCPSPHKGSASPLDDASVDTVSTTDPRRPPRGPRFMLRVRASKTRDEQRRVVGRDDLRTLRHAAKCALATLGVEDSVRKRPGFGLCYKDPVTRRTISLLNDEDWLAARDGGLRLPQPQVFLLVDVGQPLRALRTCRVEFNRVELRGKAPSFDLLARTLLPHKLADARRPPEKSPPKNRTPLKERRRRLALNLEAGLSLAMA
jgi:hypothetical protein